MGWYRTILFGGEITMSKYFFLPLGMILGIPAVVFAKNPITADSFYQVRYTENLNLSDARIRIGNTGGSAGGPLCALLYGFAANTGHMTSCCSCKIQPNALVSLSVWQNLLLDSPLPSPTPNALMIKLLASHPGLVGGGCNPISVIP